MEELYYHAIEVSVRLSGKPDSLSFHRPPPAPKEAGNSTQAPLSGSCLQNGAETTGGINKRSTFGGKVSVRPSEELTIHPPSARRHGSKSNTSVEVVSGGPVGPGGPSGGLNTPAHPALKLSLNREATCYIKENKKEPESHNIQNDQDTRKKSYQGPGKSQHE